MFLFLYCYAFDSVTYVFAYNYAFEDGSCIKCAAEKKNKLKKPVLGRTIKKESYKSNHY